MPDALITTVYTVVYTILRIINLRGLASIPEDPLKKPGPKQSQNDGQWGRLNALRIRVYCWQVGLLEYTLRTSLARGASSSKASLLYILRLKAI